MRLGISVLAFGALLWACAPGQGDGEAPESETSAVADAPGTPSASAAPATSPAVQATVGRSARYTRLDKCRVIEATSEEGGWYSAECPGEGGYKLRHTEGDLRQNIVVVPPGAKETSLALSEATKRGGFSRLGDTVEWRGRLRDGQFRPDALILRYNVIENAETPRQETSYLLTVALDGGDPCVTAMVPPGPTQNERARQIADGAMQCMR